MTKTVYFNEYNVRMGDVCYLPLVSGLLRAYAEQFDEVKAHYAFMPFIYAMDEPSVILGQYATPPDVAAFSSVMWNEQLNYHVAREVKRRYPGCLIVFGGPNVPMPPQHDVIAWMEAHPFIDVAVRAEGEEPFCDILKRFIESRDFSDIPGVAFRAPDGSISFCDRERPFKRDLSEYPSPYLEGLYDYLLAGQAEGEQKWQAIIETNRGCPFPCTFCYWGRGGLSRKYKYHDMERVFGELEWIGRNRIRYVFNADSNFGMNSRDQEIAQKIVDTKQQYGYPEKFRTCFGKNTDDKIFRIGELFHANKLEKGITLARQSNDTETLKIIRRQNISMDTYRNLQKRLNDGDIPVYGELIIGLPGETVASWKRGVDELLEAGTKNQLFVYLCQVLTNTEMAETQYRERYRIETRTIPLAEIHGSVRSPSWVTEYEEIIVGTSTMTTPEWRDMVRFSYTMMLFHSLKTAYYVMIYLFDAYGIKMSEFIDFVSSRRFTVPAPRIEAELSFYDSIVDGMLHHGRHRGTVLEAYGDFYWDVEEASFLRLTASDGNAWNTAFYAELQAIARELVGDRLRVPALFDEVFTYQRLRIPSQSQLGQDGDRTEKVTFTWNLPEYFDTRFSTAAVPLEQASSHAAVELNAFGGALRRFGRETILWGRKSGTMLNTLTWWRPERENRGGWTGTDGPAPYSGGAQSRT